ncbi:MAG: hypothetical protein AB4911_18125, partial [Oscillochloridaceae bacterium umkhey_bin13]
APGRRITHRWPGSHRDDGSRIVGRDRTGTADHASLAGIAPGRRITHRWPGSHRDGGWRIVGRVAPGRRITHRWPGRTRAAPGSHA